MHMLGCVTLEIEMNAITPGWKVKRGKRLHQTGSVFAVLSSLLLWLNVIDFIECKAKLKESLLVCFFQVEIDQNGLDSFAKAELWTDDIDALGILGRPLLTGIIETLY